jgi:hypothetical protein
LDAADPRHRGLITAIGQSAHGTHQGRIGAYVDVVDQIWNDEPPATWQAAQRLASNGLPRQRILQRLTYVWLRYGPNTADGTVDGTVDGSVNTGYIDALNALGSVSSVAKRRR